MSLPTPLLLHLSALQLLTELKQEVTLMQWSPSICKLEWQLKLRKMDWGSLSVSECSTQDTLTPRRHAVIVSISLASYSLTQNFLRFAWLYRSVNCILLKAPDSTRVEKSRNGHWLKFLIDKCLCFSVKLLKWKQNYHHILALMYDTTQWKIEQLIEPNWVFDILTFCYELIIKLRELSLI